MPTKKTRRKNSAAVAVQFAVPRRGVPAAAAFHRWALASGDGLKGVLLRIVGAREGRLLNRNFRGKDHPTTVLSFSYGGQRDIVLCHPVVLREARAQGKSVAAHYAHLVVHGMLHLRGHRHEKKSDAARMERAEIRVLARLGFPDPYTLPYTIE
jgi:probable rRNA maturation factor